MGKLTPAQREIAQAIADGGWLFARRSDAPALPAGEG